MHFGRVELVEQHGSTRSTRRTRLARRARHVELDRLVSLDTQLCCLVCISIVSKLFTNLLEYTLIYYIVTNGGVFVFSSIILLILGYTYCSYRYTILPLTLYCAGIIHVAVVYGLS